MSVYAFTCGIFPDAVFEKEFFDWFCVVFVSEGSGYDGGEGG